MIPELKNIPQNLKFLFNHAANSLSRSLSQPTKIILKIGEAPRTIRRAFPTVKNLPINFAVLQRKWKYDFYTKTACSFKRQINLDRHCP
jgi:hypothetical protein